MSSDDPKNAEIAAAFDELGTLYELDGAISYRVLAYRQAAKAIRQSPVSIAELTRAGRVTELAGIGKTTEEKIRALLEQGSIPAADKLKQKFPPSLLEVTLIPGLGAKTVRRLFEELGVASLDDLREAIAGERIRALKGLGPKAEENIAAQLSRLGADGPAQRTLLSDALPVALRLATDLREHPASSAVEIAGSARRRADTVKDIDLIATAADPIELAKALAGHELTASAGNATANGVKAATHNGIAVDLRIVAPEAYGNLLQHFTGSAAHNVALRERAVGMGLSVSEHGIKDAGSGAVTLCATEAEVYERLGLRYIEPELREGRGEINAAAAGELPKLIELEDIRGDLHSHTTLSDGKNTLEEMATAARSRGYGYFAVTDHSASHGFGDHVTAARLEERIDEIAALNESLGTARFRVLAGSEVNIGSEGKLDYPDELLARLDWVVASVHTSFRMGREKMTARFLEAIEHPSVSCIGHPSGRMLLRREPYDFDIEAITAAAARTRTMIEINGNPNRRDLNEQHARLAADAGVKICLNTDAHRVRTLDNMIYAIATARRAGLTKSEVANARPWGEFRKLIKP
ncbi:MAG: DNA polymerase/3'-5' exonuclease PolX [Actinomycetota bacterium]|nr:DNA polymerase/3'-5' exonuclease PolX [Actinomycetota bacterium]